MMYYHNDTIVEILYTSFERPGEYCHQICVDLSNYTMSNDVGIYFAFFLKTRIPKAFLKILRHVFHRYTCMLQCFVVTTCHP